MGLTTDPINGKEATKMRDSNQGRFQQQVSFLRCQFLQDRGLPFSNVLAEEVVAQALTALGTCWLDRIYSPLVTLWVFLSQVLSADHSCRAADGTSQFAWTKPVFPGDGCVLPGQKTAA
jgi:hypothetical protein